VSTTIARRIAAGRPRRPRLYFSTSLLGLGVLLAVVLSLMGAGNGTSGPRPNLSLNIAGVKCIDAQTVQRTFSTAVADATSATPNYSGVQTFGFTPPINPSGIAPFQALLKVRQSQLAGLSNSVDAGRCTDNPSASVTTADGKSVILPAVYGEQPDQPINGSQSNQDTRTVPVTAGTTGDKHRTNTWSELNDLYGDQKWYTDCTNSNLDMNWSTDVPKFESTESQHDNRFILAVNVSGKMTDEQIRQQASDDGNPNVDKLPIVRVGSIINTRHLADNQCDQFVDARSMIRVSLGKVVFDDKGNFKELEQDKGAFVDCHNLWQLPKTPPVPVTPHPTPSTTTTPPGTPPTTTPPTTTPPTSHPPTCTNGGTPPKCLQPKDSNAGAGHQGNVPTQVQGTNPPAGATTEPRPPAPPKTYTPPPPPPVTTTKPATTRTTPPPETAAPQPTDPATGCVPPPGMSHC